MPSAVMKAMTALSSIVTLMPISAAIPYGVVTATLTTNVVNRTACQRRKTYHMMSAISTNEPAPKTAMSCSM
jgi:hypothetical protein